METQTPKDIAHKKLTEQLDRERANFSSSLDYIHLLKDKDPSSISLETLVNDLFRSKAIKRVLSWFDKHDTLEEIERYLLICLAFDNCDPEEKPHLQSALRVIGSEL